jgi:uncharacterized protein (TIGR02266 family)
MSRGALHWIRTLRDTASWSVRPKRDETLEDTGIRRVSLLPEQPAVVDDEPRFADEERPTKFAYLAPSVAPPERRPSERRTSERTPWIADLEFGEDAQFFTGLSLDISEGGLFVTTYTSIPIGTRLVLSFELPDGTSVEARGEVRWLRTEATDGERPGVGIAFTELPPGVRERISDLCARQPPLYFDL